MNKLKKETIASVLLVLSVFALVLGLYGLLYVADNKYTAGAPYGNEGVLAFTADDLAANRPIFLIDGWELYPDAQYTPVDFAASSLPMSGHTFIGQYPNFSYVSANHSPFGEVTYRLRLRCAGEPRILTLGIPEIFTDYTLWVGGKQAATRGSGESVTLLLDGEAELVLNVVNHTHYYSGLTYPPALGTPETIERMLFSRLAFYGALAVCALTLAVFSSVLWLGRRRDSLFLHFGLLCICFFVTCLHPFIWRAGLSSSLWYAIEDTARLAMLFFTAAICSTVSGLSVSRCYRRVLCPAMIGLCVLCPIFVILIIPHFGGIINPYGRTLELCELLCWGYLCICAAKGLREKAAGRRVILVAGTVLGAGFFANLADNGHFEPIYTGWQTEYAGLLLVLVFGGLMIARNREILTRNEQLIYRMEELVQQRTAELYRVLEERKSFFSDMAHNLKAPIAAVHAFVSLIKDGNLYLDEELRGYLHQIESENVEMHQRVQALSTLNAFDRIHSPTEAIDVDELLRQVRRNNAPEAEASGIYFEIGTLGQPAAIQGQREKLLTLFENLIYNALSFTPMEGKISIMPHVEGGEVVIDVSDTGCGIAPEHLPHIFERFYVGRENKSEGSGLGLYIAKLTVEELGGRIAVESAQGEGTVFTIRLPLVQER